MREQEEKSHDVNGGDDPVAESEGGISDDFVYIGNLFAVKIDHVLGHVILEADGVVKNVVYDEAGDHDACPDHCAGAESGLDRILYFVLLAGGEVFLLEFQGEADVNGYDTQHDDPESPENGSGKSLQVVRVRVQGFRPQEHGHIPDQVSGEEQV